VSRRNLGPRLVGIKDPSSSQALSRQALSRSPSNNMDCFKDLMRTARRASVDLLSSNLVEAVGVGMKAPSPISHESYQEYHIFPTLSINADRDSALGRGPLVVRNPGPSDSPTSLRFDERSRPAPETLWEGPITPASFELPALEKEEQSDDKFDEQIGEHSGEHSGEQPAGHPNEQSDEHPEKSSDEYFDAPPVSERAPSRLGFYPIENECVSLMSLPTIAEEVREFDERCLSRHG
jgi:hypothetical protein